jgi:hypothetical protein
MPNRSQTERRIDLPSELGEGKAELRWICRFPGSPKKVNNLIRVRTVCVAVYRNMTFNINFAKQLLAVVRLVKSEIQHPKISPNSEFLISSMRYVGGLQEVIIYSINPARNQDLIIWNHLAIEPNYVMTRQQPSKRGVGTACNLVQNSPGIQPRILAIHLVALYRVRSNTPTNRGHG